MAAACGSAPMVDPNHYETCSVTVVTVTSTASSGNGGNYDVTSSSAGSGGNNSGVSGVGGSNVGGLGGSSGGFGGMGGDNSSTNGNGGFGGASIDSAGGSNAGGNYNVGGAGGVGGSNQGGFGGNNTGGSLNQGGMDQVSSSTIASSSATSSSTGDGNSSSSGTGGSGGNCGDLLGSFTTYTQGGWDNHAKILPASIFVNGVLIGEKNADYALFTSVKAVTDFLPAMDMPNSLKGQYVDPLTTPAGVLAGQTLTLKLNMLTSNQACGYTLGDLLVAEGTCKGKTVNQVLDLADHTLAGANMNLSYSEVNKCVEKVNLNFDNGKVDKKYLSWP